MNCKVSVNLAQQTEGGYTVTCEELPELVTEGDSVEEAMENFKDAYAATLELYEDLGRSTPEGIQTMPSQLRVRSHEDVPVGNGQL